MDLIGRQREIGIFKQVISSKQAEFVAVYGRRRVGKTFLVQQCCSHEGLYLECTGIKDGKLKEQLDNFIKKFANVFYPGISLQAPKTWKEAFELLTFQIKNLSKSKKIVLFFDELPWLASRKSDFMQNLDYFWNTEWSRLPNIKLVVCGSAASWMLNNLINAKGGLYNRITKSILLEPFTLSETKEFLEKKNFKLSNRQVLDIYMVMGGIPYYLNHIDKSKSIVQNINDLCFKKDGLLYGEFPRLFKSLFEASELNLHIVKEIAKYRYGVQFTRLVEKVGKKAGGRFSERLAELEATGFIQKFLPYGHKKRGYFYKVIDEYTVFYLQWIAEIVEGKAIPKEMDYWSKVIKSPSWYSWAGYAFESVCYKHIDKIIYALGLSKTGCFVSFWRYQVSSLDLQENGAQIDLLLDRDDGAITICEIKFTSNPFVIDKTVAKDLVRKLDVFSEQSKTKKQLFLAIVSASGVKENPWSQELVSGIVDLDNFFNI
jgi:uncharacterized protein